MKNYSKTVESGNKRAHSFCPECGTPIYSTSLAWSRSWIGSGGLPAVDTFGDRLCAAGALHDAGNQRASERQVLRRACLQWQTDPASPPESVMANQTFSPRQGTRSRRASSSAT